MKGFTLLVLVSYSRGLFVDGFILLVLISYSRGLFVDGFILVGTAMLH